jgi:hypothetical protein
MKLPESFRPIMWSYDFEACDTETMPRTIILQALQYGRFAEWRFIVDIYGKNMVRDVINDSPDTAIRVKLRPLLDAAFQAN